MFRAVRRFVGVLGTSTRYSSRMRNFIPQKSSVLSAPVVSSRFFSSNGNVTLSIYFFIVDKQFSDILTEEIKQEAENSFTYGPPIGFEVEKQDGTSILLKKSFPDGV